MKHSKITAAALAALLLSGCGGYQPASPGVISEAYVRAPEDSGTVTLYARPDTESAAVAELHANDPLKIYQLRDGWVYASCCEKHGYLQGDALRFTPETDAAENGLPAEDTGENAAENVTAPEAQAGPAEPKPITEETPGKIFVPEDAILEAVQSKYHGNVNCSGFPAGLNPPVNCTAEIRIEKIGDTEIQRGIDIAFDPDAAYCHADGFLVLYRWDWADEIGGEIVVHNTGELLAVFINIFRNADGTHSVSITTDEALNQRESAEEGV